MNKSNLKIITFILALVPTITGLIGLTGIADPIYADLSKSNNILLDSNLRFFSGVWLGLGIGIALFSIIKTIDTQTQIFRIIWGCIFLGGIGRLLSVLFCIFLHYHLRVLLYLKLSVRQSSFIGNQKSQVNEFAYYKYTYYICTDNFVKQIILICGQQK